MKHLFILVFLGILALNINAQQNPSGIPPINTPNAQAAAAWYRGGNNPSGAGTNNVFGTRWNSGIFTMTNGQYRMQLNGSVNYQAILSVEVLHS